MLSTTYVMVRSAEGASRTTHGNRAAPRFRFETNSFTRSKAGTDFSAVRDADKWTPAGAGVAQMVGCSR